MSSLMNTVRGTALKDVRAVVAADRLERSTSVGVAYFVGSTLFYLVTFVAIPLQTHWIARIAIALVNGLAVGILFIVGHDACHGSLTPHFALNRLLARAAFLPSLHPYSAWEYSHNGLHHGWTNLRGKDPVYCPRTLEEFRALPAWRQRLERIYRSWVGLIPLYLCEIWWRLEIAPNEQHRRHLDKRGTFGFDRAIVLAFPLAQSLVLLLLSASQQRTNVPELLAVGILGLSVPFFTFNFLIGFATFQHHTHPRVIWYENEAEWNFFRSQVQGTVHITFPRWIELLLHNIMEHTAHHVDVKVPLYRLTNAQRAIEEEFGEENVIVEPFSFAGIARTFASCQLYDFATHQWMSFDGAPTTAPRELAREV
jgi:omega-6 fatty acid desaturase (delta-12 desaturase)